jgi:hypothetical protein
MITALILLLIAPTKDLQADKPFSARYVGASPHRFYDQKMTVCGDTVRYDNGNIVLTERNTGGNVSLLVDPKLKSRTIRSRICYIGRIKRTDGLTPEQAYDLNKSYVIVDAEFDPQYILRP